MENSFDFAGFDGLEYLDVNGLIQIMMNAIFTAEYFENLADISQ